MVKQFITNFKIKNMNQILELKSVIGKEVSQNQSPTCRARLVSVGKSNCIFESVPSPYDKFPKPEFVGVKYKIPNWIAWNSFFF
jgi:hypothetical protein